MWQHLAVLAVLPLLATALLGAEAVRVRAEEVAHVRTAQQQLEASRQLDALRRAVDQEVLPTLALAVARDPVASARAGFDVGGTAERLLADGPAAQAAARAATDAALDAVDQGRAAPAAQLARSQLRLVREAADQGTPSPDTLSWCYLQASDALLVAERGAAVRAGSAGLRAHSAVAVNDVGLVVELTGLASRQLPLLFTAAVLPVNLRGPVMRKWRGVSGSYDLQTGAASGLSTAQLRASWTAAVSDLRHERLGHQLGASDALTRGAPGELTPTSLLLLRQSSAERDLALSRVLDQALAGATAASSAELATSERALALTVALCLTALATSAVTTVVLARRLSGSLRHLAAAARSALEGSPLARRVSGPREVRDAGDALESTAAGLRRVGEQVEAVARGDLAAALALPAAPGRLGRAVQTSVEAVVHAVEARDALRAELVHRASHDPLTGLANRATVLAELAAALEVVTALAQTSGPSAGVAPAAPEPVAVLFVDLDGFKRVNDRCGHAAGDVVLRTVAARLVAQVRTGDLVARLGGDEFVVLVRGAELPDVVELGRRLVEAVREPVPLGADEPAQSVGASVGVALSAGAQDDDASRAGARLLAEADTAVYRAKRAGRGRVVVFDGELRREEAERARLVTEVRAALAAGDLALRWEPVASTADGALLAWHALPHWARPGGGSVPASRLVAAVQEAGADRELGRWLLGAALAQAAAWRSCGAAGFGAERAPVVAVAVTDRHACDQRLLDDVTDALVAADVPPESLTVIAGESAVGADPAASWHLGALRAMGVRIAVIGVGSTPVCDLPALPAHAVSLSEELTTSDDPVHHRVVELLAVAARSVGADVVATGVATTGQLGRARAAGAHAVRGPLVGRPMTAEQAAALPLPLPLPVAAAPATRSAVPVSSPV
ncbi:diguanylate cyclase [Quadrisphaera setariae]|uniref:Diguanylate cyclase n=1 Tax=Quadrisphaera setariae TaxID=2593304 RepID=A0A5C8ZHZ0_9ACTN|nr:diguanylate cyclase [Quadrisphaera setariae]TXR56723.1 diguanylate cyclase [Quadrisphaera setariae]